MDLKTRLQHHQADLEYKQYEVERLGLSLQAAKKEHESLKYSKESLDTLEVHKSSSLGPDTALLNSQTALWAETHHS